MTIKHHDDGKKGYFRAYDAETEAGTVTYVWAGSNKFIIDHTEVNEGYKGLGIQLIEAAVAYARNNNLKIIPLCPFAKKMFERKVDIRDTLA